jgi:hypothetical protein
MTPSPAAQNQRGIESLKVAVRFFIVTVKNAMNIDADRNKKLSLSEIIRFAFSEATVLPDFFSELSNYLPEAADLNKDETEELRAYATTIGLNEQGSDVATGFILMIIQAIALYVATQKGVNPQTIVPFVYDSLVMNMQNKLRYKISADGKRISIDVSSDFAKVVEVGNHLEYIFAGTRETPADEITGEAKDKKAKNAERMRKARAAKQKKVPGHAVTDHQNNVNL